MSMWNEIAKAVQRHGFNPIIGDIQKKQAQWYNWYRGDVNGFHTFTRKVSGVVKTFERETMNMPKKICEDYVSLIWNDMCGISYKNADTKKIVDRVLNKNSFETEYGWLLELVFGVGMGYTVEYLSKTETKIDFIPYENALPLAFDNGEVHALLTINKVTIREKDKPLHITHLTYHTMENSKYVIKHEAYLSDSDTTIGNRKQQALRYIFDETELNQMQVIKRDENGKPTSLEYELELDSARPFFQVHRTNTRNHFDINSPYAVSIYATMISYFKIADVLFDMFMSEPIDNRTRIVIDHQALQTKLVENEATGQSQFLNIFDENDTVLMGVPTMNRDTGQKMIEYFQGLLRLDQLDLALNKILRIIGFRAGLGKMYYSFDDGAVYQNEKNVIFSNADTFKSKKKHEMTIGSALEGMIRSILHLEKMAGRYNGNPEEEEIEIIFDDSIVQDDEQIKEEYERLADKGYIERWYALTKILKIDEAEAKMRVAGADGEQDIASMLGIESTDVGDGDDFI